MTRPAPGAPSPFRMPEHEPTELEIVRLRLVCKGKNGGSFGEWNWGGVKGEEYPFIEASNLSAIAACLGRNDRPARIRVFGNPKEGVCSARLLYPRALLRGPERIVKVGKPPPPGSELAALAERCAHRSGDAEGEWGVGRLNDEEYATFFTSIPAIAGRLINRNHECIMPGTLKVFDYPDGQMGVGFRISLSALRSPAALLRVIK
jgi:hypothetical protein